MVNRRSDTDLGNTQGAPRGGERATVFVFRVRVLDVVGPYMIVYVNTHTDLSPRSASSSLL